MPKYEPPHRGRWAGNHGTARYIGITPMCLWRWKNSPKVKFPRGTIINGREYNDLDVVDDFMRAGTINRIDEKVA
jgi:hypothetical protein